MFEHSVKVPRHYKIAANILKKVSTEGGSVKTLLYDNKLRHFRTDVLFAIITETIKHVAEIDNIFESCNLLQNEPRLDPWLAKILTTELLYGKKELPGKSKPEQTILSYRAKFEKYKSEHQDDLKPEEAPRPRYIRVNTNLLTTSDAIRYFQDEGYKFIRCTSGSYDDYLEQVKNLTEYDFTQDYHVKTVFVFPPGTKLHNHELYLENKIILQNKASTLSVHLLAPPPGSVTLDMCAAPGMKTTQLAAYIRNNGKIYAVERNERRYQTLCDFVQKTDSNSVTTIHRDCLEIKKGEFDDVEYILLDPSCSGSGMDISVHNYIEESRLAKLTSVQEKFLKHAMNAFPKAKRIVYSTCSMFPEENERVITNVVKTSRAKWRVQDVKELLKGQWNNFGSAMYGSMGTRCLYAKPESDLTTGFFLAVLDRDQKDLEKTLKNINEEGINNNQNSTNQDYVNFEKSSNGVDENFQGKLNDPLKKKKKKHKFISDDINYKQINNSDATSENIEVQKPKKKHKSICDDINHDQINNSDGKNDKIEIEKPKKKKMLSVTSNLEDDSNDFHKSVGDNYECIAEQPAKKKKKNRDRTVDIESAIDTDSVKSSKKHKLEDHVENLVDDLDNLVVDNTQYGYDEPVKKKKKKKDKNRTLVADCNSNNVATLFDEDKTQKSKNRGNQPEGLKYNDLDTSVKKHKKKRNKEKQEMDSDKLEINTEMFNEPPKKKQKKHKGNETIC